MRKILFALCVLVAMVAITHPAVAQTIDIVDYMDVTPGQWRIEHSVDMCSGWPEDNAITISTYGSFTLSTYYDNIDGNWIPDSREVSQITPNSVISFGEYDYETGMLSISTPPSTIPRSLSLNEPVFNSGTVTTGLVTEPYAEIFMITEIGVSVTTPAGTFNNCIKIKVAAIEDSSATYTCTEILAPGIGTVTEYEAWIEEVGGVVETGTGSSEITRYWIP